MTKETIIEYIQAKELKMFSAISIANVIAENYEEFCNPAQVQAVIDAYNLNRDVEKLKTAQATVATLSARPEVVAKITK